MMVSTQMQYRYQVDCFAKEHRFLGRLPLEEKTGDLHWEPAREWTFWQGVKAQKFTEQDRSELCEAPLFDDPPYLKGFQVYSRRHDLDYFHCYFHAGYFRDAATAAILRCGTLPVKEIEHVSISAVPAEPRVGLTIKLQYDLPPLREGKRQELFPTRQLARFGPSEEDDWMPVFIGQRVLQKIRLLANPTQKDEIGGLLVGYLYRDSDDGEIFAVVTDQIPALHTVASATQLRFTPQTWHALCRKLRDRTSKEISLGWWHSHPFLLSEQETVGSSADGLAISSAFFSLQDMQVQRTAFWGATHLALVMGFQIKEGKPLSDFKLFGWNRGLILERGFFEVNAGS